ncbi:LEAF RUST 10 DISEASE-RESISTANCE LOCUS RECEPTOR-LIKE PROTEIN KINASE-like 1.2 [Glycine soja]
MDIHIHMLLTSISCLFLITLPQSLSQPPSVFNYSACKESPYKCGTLPDIFYPFWGESRPPQCGGGQAFRLSCNHDNITTILIASHNFTVKNIHDTTRTMRVVTTDLGPNDCSLLSKYIAEDIHAKATRFLYPNFSLYSIDICEGFEMDLIPYAVLLQKETPHSFSSSLVFSSSFSNLQNQMILQISFHYNKPQLCIITTILFLATTVLSSNPKFEACSPRSCGTGPPIKYPFWIPYEQEPFCGYPHFGITCMDKNPILRTSNYEFLVKDIYYSNSSFTVANIDVYEDKCPVPLYNYTFDQTPFTYSSENWNLSFFYNCSTEPIDYPTYEVDCAKNATHFSFAVFHKEALEHKNYSLNECQFMVNTPLNINESVNISSLLRMNYTEILKMGFVLNWTAPDCHYCEKSGGRCGFDGNQFLCFCKDKSYLKSCGSDPRKLRLIIGVVSGVVGALGMGIIGFLCYRRKKNRYAISYIQSRSLSSDPSSKDTEKGVQSFTQSFVPGVPLFLYDELEEATNYFDSSKELGEGGFGTVYFGKLRDGRSVAVKRLYENNFKRVAQFMNEIKILAKLVHPNLVKLYGCTSRHSRELLLVYEYIPNGTVADHLHGQRSKPGKLPWHIRMKIAVETASALNFLHHKDVIHRDVKTNNILLDSDFCVKVADFGLSRLFPDHVTHVSTAPQGTPGYVDPEYHQCYQLTKQSDVYSFGVVLVELISSLPAVDITRHRHEINLSNMAINKIHNQALHELVDPTLGFESDFKVRKMINAVAELAFQCLQSSKEMRPSMEEVVETLKDIQSDGKHKSQPEVMDITSTADDVVLLKDDPPPPSPDSNAVSKSTTPNASG